MQKCQFYCTIGTYIPNTHMLKRHPMDKELKEKMIALSLIWAVFAIGFLIVVRAMF